MSALGLSCGCKYAGGTYIDYRCRYLDKYIYLCYIIFDVHDVVREEVTV